MSNNASVPRGPVEGRLATVIRRAAWPVIIGWIVLTVVATPLAEKISEIERDDSAAYLPSGFDSTTIAQWQEASADQSGSTALVLFSRDGDRLSEDDQRAIDAERDRMADELPATPGVGEVAVSEVDVADDGEAAYFAVSGIDADDDSDAEEQTVDALRSAGLSVDGMTVQVTGEAALDVDNNAGDVDAVLLLTSMVIVAVLLLLTYRSPILWLVPLLCAVVAVQVARGVVYELGRAGLAVTDISSAILIVLVFGAATDYALLLINRYREELANHDDRYVAIAVALRRTLPALVASAGTVVAGLLCLLAASLAGLSGLGPIAASGVVVSLLVMTTLLPAVLAVAGRGLLWPRAPRPGDTRRAPEHRIWRPIAAHVVRWPVATAAAAVVFLGAAAFGLAGLHTSADPIDKVPPTSESAEGMAVFDDHFPIGRAAPVLVVLSPDAPPDQIDAAQTAIEDASHVATVDRSDTLNGRPTLQVDLDVPSYGGAADASIDDIRSRLADVDTGALVGGDPVVQLDYRDAALDDTMLIVPLVLLAITLILGLLLRSIVAPLMLIGTVVLSFAGSLGLATLGFHHLLGYGGVAGDLFIYVFVFLVALGVDYNIFLMDRIREERRHGGTVAAVRNGLMATGGVITAAGLVLAGTFLTLAQLPDVTVAEVGLAVGLGVLVDTLIVRTLLVPALVVLLGDRTWWPGSPGRTPKRAGPALDRETAQRTR